MGGLIEPFFVEPEYTGLVGGYLTFAVCNSRCDKLYSRLLHAGRQGQHVSTGVGTTFYEFVTRKAWSRVILPSLGLLDWSQRPMASRRLLALCPVATRPIACQRWPMRERLPMGTPLQEDHASALNRDWTATAHPYPRPSLARAPWRWPAATHRGLPTIFGA